MRRLPPLLKHDAILSNWRSYPKGSIERAKALGIEVLSTCSSLEATIELWESEKAVVAEEQPWKPLGLSSLEAFIEAVTGRSEKEVAKQITKTEAIRERREKHPNETQQQTADAVGCDQSLVAKVMNKSSQSDESFIVPDWLSNPNMRAAFRKLPEDEQERIAGLSQEERRGSVRRAALAAGVVKDRTPFQLLCAAWKRADASDRESFMTWVNEQ